MNIKFAVWWSAVGSTTERAGCSAISAPTRTALRAAMPASVNAPLYLIGLVGKRSDVVAHRLTSHHNFTRLSFLDSARDMLAAMLYLSREQLDRHLLDPHW